MSKIYTEREYCLFLDIHRLIVVIIDFFPNIFYGVSLKMSRKISNHGNCVLSMSAIDTEGVQTSGGMIVKVFGKNLSCKGFPIYIFTRWGEIEIGTMEGRQLGNGSYEPIKYPETINIIEGLVEHVNTRFEGWYAMKKRGDQLDPQVFEISLMPEPLMCSLMDRIPNGVVENKPHQMKARSRREGKAKEA